METDSKKVMTDKIEEFNGFNDFRKFHTLITADVEFERRKLRQVIEKASGYDRCDLICVFGDIALIQLLKKDYEKYPYTYLVMNEAGDKWNRGHEVFDSVEKAALGALGFKHDGSNSRFEFYASRMLGMNK